METLSGSGPKSGVCPLAGRVRWLISLRWLAVVALVGIVTVASQLLHVHLRLLELYLTAGILALLNLAFSVAYTALQIAQDRTEARARVFANVQITSDLALLAALIHYSGGVENPFAFYFVFHVIVSGALLSAKEAWAQAGVAALLFCGLVELERTGVLAHYHVPGLTPDALYRDPLYVAAVVVAFASTICVAAYTGISISRLLREKQQESVALIAQLEQAYRKLDELGRSKSRHMRRVSHELRAPLGAIHNLLAMLEGTLTGEGRSDERALAERAAKRVDQALKLVDDLLTLARSEDARFTVKMKEIHLPQAIGDVAGMLRPRADREGITLNVDVPQNLPPILGDAESLEQLFSNLIANAIKYTAEAGRVSVKAAPQGDRVVVTVADTGIGISEEDLPCVFDEFYRGKNARQFAEQGTGLGLSIVKSIAETHAAEMRIESNVGRGTTFEISMPRADAKAARGTPAIGEFKPRQSAAEGGSNGKA